jgi:hypothetical protein
LERADDLGYGLAGGSTNFEVPNPDNKPAVANEIVVYPPVARDISGDLFVPVDPRSPRAVPRRVPVPEGAIDKYRDVKPRPR